MNKTNTTLYFVGLIIATLSAIFKDTSGVIFGIWITYIAERQGEHHE